MEKAKFSAIQLFAMMFIFDLGTSLVVSYGVTAKKDAWLAVMGENEFVSKYLNIINKLAVQFESEVFTDKREIEKMSGYNNAIVSILKCINPIYEYDLNDKSY